MKKKLEREVLTDDQVLYTKQRATDIWFRIQMKGDTCYGYDSNYHFWWDGLPHGDPQMALVQGGLVDLDNLEDIWTTLKHRGYLSTHERLFWRVIAEAFRDLACKPCVAVSSDPRLDEGLTHTRGKRMKHITVKNYIWEWLHGTHTTMTI